MGLLIFAPVALIVLFLLDRNTRVTPGVRDACLYFGAFVFSLVIALRPGMDPFAVPIISPAASLAHHPFWNTGPVAGGMHMTDISCILQPLWMDIRAQLHAGQWPVWTDGLFAGCPVWANPQAGVLSPWHWLFFWLGDTGLTLMALTRWAVALAGMYLLARRAGAEGIGAAIAGAIYAFCGPMVIWVLYPMGGALALWPWMAYFAAQVAGRGCRRDGLFLTLCATFLVLSGHPESALWGMCIALAAGWIAGRDAGVRQSAVVAKTGSGLLRVSWKDGGLAGARRVFGYLVVGGLLAAPMWLPFLHYLAESGRLHPGVASDMTWDELIAGIGNAFRSLAATPEGIWREPLRSGTVPAHFEETTFSIGIFGVLAAVLALFRKGAARWWAMAGWGLFLLVPACAMAQHLWLKGVPFVGDLLVHRLLQVAMLPMALAVGCYVREGVGPSIERRLVRWGILAMLAAAALVYIILVLESDTLNWALILTAAMVALPLLLVILFIYEPGSPSVRAFLFIPLTMMCAAVPLCAAKDVYPMTPAIAKIRTAFGMDKAIAGVTPAPRVVVTDDAVCDQALSPYGIARLNAWDGLKPWRIDAYLGLSGQTRRVFPTRVTLARADLLQLAGVDGAIGSPETAAVEAYLSWDNPTDKPDAPRVTAVAGRRAWWIADAVNVPSADAALSWLRTHRLRLQGGMVAELPVEKLSLRKAQPGRGRIDVVEWRTGQVRVKTECEEDGFVMVAVTAMPGWVVRNGVTGAILDYGIAAGAFLAFRADPGTHEYTLTYERVPGLRDSVPLVVTGFVGLLGLMAVQRRRVHPNLVEETPVLPV